MKKLVLLFAFVVLAATSSFAQFRYGFMLDYGIPTVSSDKSDATKVALGDYTNGGFGGRLIFRYAVTEQIDVGAEGGAYLFAGGSVDATTGDIESIGATAMTSALITGDYYFSNNRFAPYAGAGIGYSNSVQAGGSSTDGNALSATSFAFVPRAGIKFGAFNFDLAYNMLLGAATDGGAITTTTESTDVSVNNSYLRFGIGFIFGSRY